MAAGRIIAGTMLSAILVAGSLVAPALDAREAPRHHAASVDSLAMLGTFTPASADPKLTAVLARSGVGDNFRFTPTGTVAAGGRAVTVAVQARSTRNGGTDKRDDSAAAAAAPTVSLAPIAYNLGVSVGWKRLAVSGDMTKIDLAGQPGSQQRVDVGLSYTGKRASASVSASKSKPLDPRQELLGDLPAYTLDVGGAYKLTRNLDVTAGVRYKSERERLPQLDDNRRDSQAVYIGTSFRF